MYTTSFSKDQPGCLDFPADATVSRDVFSDDCNFHSDTLSRIQALKPLDSLRPVLELSFPEMKRSLYLSIGGLVGGKSCSAYQACPRCMYRLI